jgi:hypothetical protein
VDEFTEKTDTESNGTATPSSLPDGLNPTRRGSVPVPVANDELFTGVSAPAEFTENTDKVPGSSATSSSPPDGLNATDATPPWVANGEPGTGVTAPAGFTENTHTTL